MYREIIFGPPGCGKTYTLLKYLEEVLLEGIPPERIAFLTFTRRARREALERVEQVLGIKAKELPHFRTIHSMAFKGLGLKEGDVMGWKELAAFGNGMGLTFGRTAATELAAEGISSQEKGDALLALDNLARLRGCGVEQAWRSARADLTLHDVQHFSSSYTAFKKELGLLDFTDVLSEFAKSGKKLPVDVAFVDEAQDLSALQWYATLQAVEGAGRQYVAGDDDQAIFRWAGAEVEFFMQLPGTRRVLSHSFRLLSNVHAAADKILSRIKTRVPKDFAPRGVGGIVQRHAGGHSLPIREGERWLYLVRNRYLLPALKEQLEQRAIVYTQHGSSSIVEEECEALYDWERLRAGKALPAGRVRRVYAQLRTKLQLKHGAKALPGVADTVLLSLQQLKASHGLLVEGTWFDTLLNIPPARRAYYRALLRAHKTLRLPPQVQLETIHGAKGTEAPHVALFLEQSRRVYDDAQRDADEEHRVWYVGCTRARESLHVIESSSRWGYPFPLGPFKSPVSA